MQIINTPHDHFIKELFSDREKARDFLLNFTPKHLLKLINLDEIEIVKDSFVDEELKDYFSDILGTRK